MALSDPDKTCGCGQGHVTYGACLRAKNVTIAPAAMPTKSGFSKSDLIAHESRLDNYAAARKQGIQPTSTEPKAVQAAVAASDKVGAAFDAGTGGFKK